MKSMKNVSLIVVAVLTVALAVGGMFAVRKVLNKEKNEVPTPEPVAVETKTETPGGTQEETPAPAPVPAATPSPQEMELSLKVQRVLAAMNLHQKIGQMFLVDMSQLGGSNNTSINQRTRSRLDTYPVGGVLLTGANMVSTTQAKAFIQELQKNADMPMFIAVDEEGGDSSPLAANPNLDIPSVRNMHVYGINRDAEGAAEAAKQIAQALGNLGCNLNFAPMADVIVDEENNVLGDRSFGTDAKMVAQMAEGQIRASQGLNVSAAMKYFPGCGAVSAATGDGYAETTRTKEEMRAVEWIPYMTGTAAGVDAIMLSNISAPALTGDRTPCSLSKKVVEILRSEIGYRGMIISGPLNEQAITKYYSSSEAVLKAIDAGVDVILQPGSLEGTYSAVESAVRNGSLSEERIDQSVSHILAVKIVRGLIHPEDYPELKPTPDPDEEDSESDWSEEEDDWSEDEDDWSEDEGDWSEEEGDWSEDEGDWSEEG